MKLYVIIYNKIRHTSLIAAKPLQKNPLKTVKKRCQSERRELRTITVRHSPKPEQDLCFQA